MNIILMGPPGAGKGTQAEFIKANFPIPHISTGDMFREAVSNGTDMGREAKKYMDSGQLVPDSVTIGIVADRLKQPDCQDGFMLDGFPRTTVQAEALTDVLAKLGKKLEAAINISVPDDILIQRMSGRVSCENCKTVYNTRFNPSQKEGICDKCGGKLIHRDDDKEETVKNRLTVYMDQTKPLIQYYSEHGILHDVNGNRDTREVFDEIKAILGSLLND